MSTVSKHQFLS